ncbi:ER degradation-enhancing alpha-mannosidase-like protein 2 [Tubulanus polymorphus]|uniref:ER degradation-enhancing alpha-mannosidase-like protein 2 n=1 Tax=Tubulanus polymorphus TaxID=672921 RepID=UPI003DA3ED13
MFIMLKCILRVVIAIPLLSLITAVNVHRFTDNDFRIYKDRAKNMFAHAYNGYMNNAYPYDELRPLTCDGHDTWGSFSLTLIDALDTLAIMGNCSEFNRVTEFVKKVDFDMDINASVFETNIRVVGGLLSAHLLSNRCQVKLNDGWPCSGPLLDLAENVARRLLPAFQTKTGMPYGTVNLRHGIPKDETSVTCTAGVGTFIVEFGTLSRLTGDPVFEEVALKALDGLWNSRSEIGLVGNHIDVQTGKWTALDTGIGAGVDSYFEYLVKASMLFNKPHLLHMFKESLVAIEKYVKKEDWYLWVGMKKGTVTLPVFQSLDAYWPGLQSLLGDIDKAMKTIHNYHQVWTQFGAVPEFYNIPKAEVHSNRESYPLRPELAESVMYLYRATNDPYLLQVAVDMLEAIETTTKTKCGYATIKNVNNLSLENRMESFFLAETIKYLYLTFDRDNFINADGSRGTLINTPNGECVIGAGGYIFNTEAHPIDAGAVHCCSAEKKRGDETIQRMHDDIDLLSLLNIEKARRRSAGGEQKYDDTTYEFHLRKTVLTKTQPATLTSCKSSIPFVTAPARPPPVAPTDERFARRTNFTEWQRKNSDYSILSCPVQPFHSRLSIMGEIFDN